MVFLEIYVFCVRKYANPENSESVKMKKASGYLTENIKGIHKKLPAFYLKTLNVFGKKAGSFLLLNLKHLFFRYSDF